MEQLQFLQNSMHQAIIKLEIPSMHKKQALRELLKMNLHRASLFPDLDGYALSMKLRYNSMKTPEERAQEYEKKRSDRNYPFFP